MERFDLREYAVKGAEQRLLEIAREARTIFQTFPELRKRGRGFDVEATGPALRASVDATTATRGPRKMSAAGRKRISDAAKRRWAQWRKTRKTPKTRKAS